MFGRSGQMFPRRTFHDAIYEEEYGSDSEDECCRCRGLSAILCWFLSVIILVGLAATVVLTVFFILRSRTLMAKPDADLDVEMYGKEQNLFDSNGGGGTSKELIGGEPPSINAVNESGSGLGGGGRQRKKSNSKSKNDVDGDVNEEQNAISDSSEDGSVNHHRHHHTHRPNRLQPYSPTRTTTTPATSTTGESPTEASDEERESSSEEETEHGNDGEGSSLLNLFSGPRNPSYSAPEDKKDNDANEDEDEEADEEEENEPEDPAAVISAESSSEYKSTRYPDGAPVQQVLFTESPKVTVTTPNPYNNRRNLQTTRFPTGRTSFSTTTTQMPPVKENTPEPEVSEEADVEEEVEEEEEEQDQEGNVENENEVTGDNEEISREEGMEDGDFESQKETEKSSEEEPSSPSVPSKPTTTTMYDRKGSSGESEMVAESGENQLKQMLLDSIPPHGNNKENEDEGGSSVEFNLAQRRHFTTSTTGRPNNKVSKPTIRARQDTLTRLISRNFTRKQQDSETETSTIMPSVTTLGPAGHKYDFTMTPIERTKLKIKSGESLEQEELVSKPTPKSRYRSTTSRPSQQSSRPPITGIPRTRGTTVAGNSNEWNGIKLGDKRGSGESPIDIVPSPDLSRKPNQQQQPHQINSLEGVDLTSSEQDQSIKTSSEQQFLDVLVGSDDQKTLVTKKTDDGVVTSAILPPWYDANGTNSSITDVLATNGTSLSNAVAKVEEDELMLTGIATDGDQKQNQPPASNSEFERLVNMFSKQEGSSEEEQTPPPPPSRFGFKKQNKPIVLKKPGGQINSRFVPQVPGRAGFRPNLEKAQTSPATTPSSPSTTAETNAKSSEHGDVGRAGVLPTAADVEAAVANSGYYPDNNENSDKIVEEHHIESERLPTSDETETDSVEGDEPSHVIDVNFEEAAGTPAEIIIEQDSSAPVGDGEEGDFAEDDDDGDYEDVEEENLNNSPSQQLSMAASAQNQNFVAAPNDYIRGSGIRKPVSSEESLDAQASNINATSTMATSTFSPLLITSSIAPAVIRRPAYTREEIAKAVVKPASENNHLNDGSPNGGGSGEGIMESGEFEEYEDDNYEGGSMEQAATGSVEAWSNEKVTHRWSAPDKVRNDDDGTTAQQQQQHQQNFANEELLEESEPVNVAPVPLQNRLSHMIRRRPDEAESPKLNSTFRAPLPVSFHENKLSFSAPIPDSGNPAQYHSKDGWRPVITDASNKPATSQEDEEEDLQSGQVGLASFEPELEPTPMPQQLNNQQLFTQEPMSLPSQVVPIQHQQQQPLHQRPHAMIPPPASATIKFPDSEEDHEDRRHHGRHRPRNQLFDRSKFLSRPVPPPIVMRRHPHSTGPFPPPPSLNNRQGPPPPPPPPQQRTPQMLPQASQQNPQFVEPPPQQSPPQRPPINRNFHIRPNPMRRFNFGGPPQAQPRSGGNIKWPTDDNADSNKNNPALARNNAGKRPNIESVQSEVTINNRRRRRRRTVGVGLHM